MPDVFTEVTSEGWGSRIGNSLSGILFGLLLLLVATVGLFWNESRAIKRTRALEEGQCAVKSVKADRVIPENEGKLVHLSGMATTDEELHDTQFGVRAKAIKLVRHVSMYQWTERKESKKEKKYGGGTSTTTKYYYDKDWESHAVDSSQFKESEGHRNPPMPFTGTTLSARQVRLGAYQLSPGLINKMDQTKPMGVTAKTLEGADAAIRSSFRIQGAGLYKGANPSSPAIGDIKVEFQVVAPQNISLVARQTGVTFEPYGTKAGDTIELLRPGTFSSEAMFQKAIEENANLTWILRLAGVVVMTIGFALIFSPLSVMADVVPFLGNLVSTGTTLISIILGVSLSCLVIAVGWVFCRPYIGLPLLAVAIALPLLAILRGRNRAAPVPVPIPSGQPRRRRGARPRATRRREQ